MSIHSLINVTNETPATILLAYGIAYLSNSLLPVSHQPPTNYCKLCCLSPCDIFILKQFNKNGHNSRVQILNRIILLSCYPYNESYFISFAQIGLFDGSATRCVSNLGKMLRTVPSKGSQSTHIIICATQIIIS